MSATERISLDALITRLGNANTTFANPQDFLEDVGLALEGTTKKRFDEQSSPDGSPWKPPSALTIYLRSGSKGGEKALQDTGALLSSISHFVESNVVHVGSGLIYARIHQEGGTISAKNAPALTIPLHPAARRMGYKRLKEKGLFKLPGKPVLALPASDGSVTPMFALKKSVNIPQRKFLGLSQDDERILAKIVFDHADRSLS